MSRWGRVDIYILCSAVLNFCFVGASGLKGVILLSVGVPICDYPVCHGELWVVRNFDISVVL